jgi:ABC-type branched-subunit amino acid transport system ATPase component
VRQEPAGSDALEVADLRVSFGGLNALDGASITVRPGEIVGLIGPNGAGKTTLINAVSGMLPARGRVRLYGVDVSDLPPDMRWVHGLGRSFQDASLFAGLTVREVIQVAVRSDDRYGFAAAVFRLPWAMRAQRNLEQAADEIIERFSLEPYADTLAADLSTGIRRICDMAAQVAARPRLLLLDEPTAGVAQRETDVFPPLLRRIRDELGCAIVIVEHDMSVILNVCERIYAMESGQVIAEGTPDQIRRHPRVIASYLGDDHPRLGDSDGHSDARARARKRARRA